MKRAIISVFDKTNLQLLGEGLHQLGFELVSSSGTARALRDFGLPVIEVSDVTDFPEMMDGRVKTLHPKIHAGILARRHVQEDLALAAENGIQLTDVVAVNLYPFMSVASKPGVDFDTLVENIDIGGPSLLRGAAKNHRDVLVLTSPKNYAEALEMLATGGTTLAFRYRMALAAFTLTGQYDTQIASTMRGWAVHSDDETMVKVCPVG